MAYRVELAKNAEAELEELPEDWVLTTHSIKFKENCHDSILATDSHLAVSVTESLFSPRRVQAPPRIHPCRRV
jgi:hypothetical protein